MKKINETIFLCIFTVCFWGAFYPNMSLTKDVYKMYYEDNNKEFIIEDEVIAPSQMKKGNIRVKSKLWEYIQEVF